MRYTNTIAQKLAAVTFIAAAFAGVFAQTPTPTPVGNNEARIRVEKVYGEGKDLFDKKTAESFRQAIERFAECRDLSKKAGIRYWEAICTIGIAQSHEGLGDRKRAIEVYEEAVPIAMVVDKRLWAGILREMANINNEIGEHAKALQQIYAELALREELNDGQGQIDTLHSAAIILSDLGQLDEGIRANLLVLKLQKQVKTPLESVTATLNNLAFAYYRKGSFQTASVYYFKAYNIAIALKRTDLQGPIAIGIGDSYLKLGQPGRAMASYLKGLALAQKHNNRIFEADALFGIGNVHRAFRQPKKALEPYNQSLAIHHAEQAREEESRGSAALMSLWKELNNPQMAILYGKKAVNLNQDTRRNLSSLTREIQRQYVRSKEGAYRELADLLIADGRLPEAQAVLDMLKEQEFEQFTTVRSGDQTDLVPYRNTETNALLRVDALATLGSRQRELTALQSELGANFPQDKLAELEQVRRDVEAANREFRLAIEALAITESSVEDKLSEIKTEKNLQRTLEKLGRELNTGVVSIYTVIGTAETKPAGKLTPPKFGWAVLVTPESRKAFPIDVRGMEKTVLDFRAALSTEKYDPKPLAQKLYDAIFRQTSQNQKTTLESDLNITLAKYQNKTIMWSLDGLLRYVPMAALHDGKTYLAEKYRQTVFTKQSLLLLNEKDSPDWQALGLGVSEAKTVDKLKFDALDGAKRELLDIVRQPNETTGILRGTRVLDGDFTKDNAIRLWREGKYQAVHIASHFSFDPVNQDASFLVVGDGKLTFADIQDKDNLFGSVDLLTLSACDTAMSSNGKESEGFPFLAQSLGAKTVIASLWKVSDAGTPELMIRFYKLRAEDPQMPKGEAFRRAQISLLSGEARDYASAGVTKSVSKGKRSDPFDLDGTQSRLPLFVKDPAKPFAHPYYWASFVLIGNWR